MDKLYYDPTREEMAAVVGALFAPQLDANDVEALLDAFPAQPLDFFGALKSRLVDGEVRRWLGEAGGAQVGGRLTRRGQGGAEVGGCPAG